jgi:hypothetical protein
MNGFHPALRGMLVWIGAVAVAAALAALPAQAQVDTAKAESLVKRSGLWDAMAGFPAQVRAGMAQAVQQSGRPPSAEATERIGRVIDEAFAAGPLRASATASLAAHLPPAHVPAIDAWLDSAVGSRIARLEVASAQRPPEADPQAAMRRSIALYQGASAARKALIDSYVRHTRAAELAHEAMVVTALAVARGVGAANPELPRPSLSEFEGFLRGQKAQALPAMAMVMTANAADAYEPLTDAELGSYVEFLQGDAGQAFNVVASKALIDALKTAGETMGRNLRGATDAARS